MKPIKQIVIVDHQPLYRKALADVLGDIIPQAEILEIADAQQMQHYFKGQAGVDMVILELPRKDKHAIEALQLLHEQRPDVVVIAMADYELPSHWQGIVEQGLNGFIPKTSSVEQINHALTTIAKGKHWFPSCDESTAEFAECDGLTPQQSRILSLLRRGLLNKQIADHLGISEATVRTHMTAIFKKLGVNNRTQAVVVSQKHARETLAATA